MQDLPEGTSRARIVVDSGTPPNRRRRIRSKAGSPVSPLVPGDIPGDEREPSVGVPGSLGLPTRNSSEPARCLGSFEKARNVPAL